MFKNFLKTTLRNCWKNKSYTSLNIVGLAVGIACAGLIFLWVEDELGYDGMYAKKERLYWIRENQTYNGVTRTFNATPGPLAAAMKAEIPGVMNTCRTTSNKKVLFSLGDKQVYEEGCYADTSFFNLFTLKFTEGNAANAFRGLYSVVITRSMARRFFGTDNNVTGKALRVDNKRDYVVSGVIEDFADNSTLQLSWIAPFDIFMQGKRWLLHWPGNGIRTYAELSPAADPAAINKTLYGFIEKHEKNATARPLLFAMNDWRLRDNFENGVQRGGRIAYVRLFSIIAWVILLIACINFMNLATARSEKRAREVGVRKVLGAARGGLAGQFIAEAILLSVVSVLAGMLIMALLMPAFNVLAEKQLSPHFARPVHAAALLSIALICGLVAGSYPALYLSSFNPIFVFKGIRSKNGSAALVRKGLVVLQFTVSIVLIISTVIIYQQVQHIRSRDIGYNRDNLLDMEVRGNMVQNFPAIRQDLINTGLVESAALASTESIYTSDNTDSFTWDGKDPSVHPLISVRDVSPEYLRTMGMHVIKGRDFFNDGVSDSNHVIITASLEQMMGAGSAIGKTLRNDDNRYEVVGVIQNYVYGDMNAAASDPVIFFSTRSEGSYMYVRSKPAARTDELLSRLDAVMKKDNPGYPMEYNFVDDQYAAIYKSEMLVGKLSRVFAALAILISCLGLFGLAAYTAERRVKEIGIRKVLGAGTGRVAAMLSKDFLQLVFISSLLAFPIAWWYMHRWLQGYSYRVTIQAWVFIAAGATAVLIALATIGARAVKAGMVNPVKSLRSE